MEHRRELQLRACVLGRESLTPPALSSRVVPSACCIGARLRLWRLREGARERARSRRASLRRRRDLAVDRRRPSREALGVVRALFARRAHAIMLCEIVVMTSLDVAFGSLLPAGNARAEGSPRQGGQGGDRASSSGPHVGTFLATFSPAQDVVFPNLGVELHKDASGRLYGGSADESWFGAFVLPATVRDGTTVEIRPGRWGVVRLA